MCTCRCLTKFPSLPVLGIFSPKPTFFCLLFKSSLLAGGGLAAVLAKKGLAKREGLDILNSRRKQQQKEPTLECYLLGQQILKILRASLFNGHGYRTKRSWTGRVGLLLGFLLNRKGTVQPQSPFTTSPECSVF